MSKRRVPAALHRELSEYASLLRALRTRDTMDVTKYLTKPSPFTLSQNDGTQLNREDDVDELLGDASSSKRMTSPSPLSDSPDRSSSICSSSKGKDGPKKKRKQRDQWTRWPVMLEDVLKPEWTLEDEVAVVASQVMKARSHPLSKISPDAHPSEESDDGLVVLDLEVEDDDPDPPFYVPSLTYIIANFLSTILTQLASHTPARPCSMQNRIEPLNWQAVINAVISSDIPEYSNSDVVLSVIKRMEAIYGPSTSSLKGEMSEISRAGTRIQEKNVAVERFRRLHENAAADIFTQASPSMEGSPTPTVKRKRRVDDDREEKDFVARGGRIQKSRPARRERSKTADGDGRNAEKAGDSDNDAGPVRRSSRQRSYIQDVS